MGFDGERVIHFAASGRADQPLEAGPRERKLREVGLWLRTICPEAKGFASTFEPKLSAKEGSQAPRWKIEITRHNRLFTAHVDLYASEVIGQPTDPAHPELSYTLDRTPTTAGMALEETLRVNLESWGAVDLEFAQRGSTLVMTHRQSDMQLRFEDRSGPKTENPNGNLYFETIPQV